MEQLKETFSVNDFNIMYRVLLLMELKIQDKIWLTKISPAYVCLAQNILKITIHSGYLRIFVDFYCIIKNIFYLHDYFQSHQAFDLKISNIVINILYRSCIVSYIVLSIYLLEYYNAPGRIFERTPSYNMSCHSILLIYFVINRCLVDIYKKNYMNMCNE